MIRLGRMFSDSLKELRSLPNLTLAAMLLAVSVCLSFLSFQPFPFLKIGFSYLALAAVGMFFGPTVGFLVGGACDILGYLIKPTGDFNLLMTLIAALGGMIWGLFLYKNRTGLLRVILAKTTITVVCNLILTTAVLCLYFGSAFAEIFPLRVLKNLCALPVEIALTYFLCRVLQTIRSRVGRT